MTLPQVRGRAVWSHVRPACSFSRCETSDKRRSGTFWLTCWIVMVWTGLFEQIVPFIRFACSWVHSCKWPSKMCFLMQISAFDEFIFVLQWTKLRFVDRFTWKLPVVFCISGCNCSNRDQLRNEADVWKRKHVHPLEWHALTRFRLPQLSSGGVKGRNKCDPTERAKAVALSDRASKTFQKIEVDNIYGVK